MKLIGMGLFIPYVEIWQPEKKQFTNRFLILPTQF